MARLGPSSEQTPICLTQAFEPLGTPSFTSPKPPEAMGWRQILRTEDNQAYKDCEIVLAPHSRLSSRRHFWKVRLAGLEVSEAYYRSLSVKRKSGTRRCALSRSSTNDTKSSPRRYWIRRLLMTLPMRYATNTTPKLGGRPAAVTEVL